MSGMLDGRVAIVTGVGAGGQGEATAKLFAAEGARLCVVDIDGEAARSCADALGKPSIFMQADVSVADDWAQVIDACLGAFGQLDILVNNAAIFSQAPLEATSQSDFERYFRVNQLSVYLGMTTCLAALKKTRGCIVNIASIGGASGAPNAFSYSTSKWAVRGMSRCAARDLSKFGIRVNTVLPGVIDTDMAATAPPEQQAAMLAATPLGRVGQAREVASATLFLASGGSSFMTGAEVVVDGGLIA